jgi:hypothetical protein
VFQPRSLIPPATDYVAEHGVFFHRFRQEKDVVVNSLCQFDFLQCLIVFHSTGDDTRSFPNFGVYFKERTEPIIRQLIDGGPARSVLPGVDDARLAQMIRVLDQNAAHAFFGTAGWELGWSDPRIDDFLRQHDSK